MHVCDIDKILGVPEARVRLPVGNKHTDRPKSGHRNVVVWHTSSWAPSPLVLCPLKTRRPKVRAAPTHETGNNNHHNYHHKSENKHKHSQHSLTGTMVNNNSVFEALSAADRKQKIGQVFISSGNIRYITLYPDDQFICPWCGTTSMNINSLKKHWQRCTPYVSEHPSLLGSAMRPVVQLNVEPTKKAAPGNKGSSKKNITNDSPKSVSLKYWLRDMWTSRLLDFCKTFTHQLNFVSFIGKCWRH